MTNRSSKPPAPRAGGKKKARNPAPIPAFPLSNDDDLALDAFCASIACDEISFETWESSHETLALTVPIWLSLAEAQAGGERMVSFVRSVQDDRSAQPARQPATLLVTIPPRCQNGQKILIKDQGDRALDQRGDLTIIVHVKA